MAKFVVSDYYDFGTNGFHNATSWQVATDENFEDIIDESLEDKINVTEWHSPLKKKGGGYHKTLDVVYVRVKIHIDNTVSDWFVGTTANQNDQELIYTMNGVVIDTANSLDIGFKQGE